MRKSVWRAVVISLAVSVIMCSCITKIGAEENTEDVLLSFGTWVQTEGEYALPLEIAGEWSALLLEIALPEGCKITGVSVADGGRAAASAFLSVKHRAAVALTSPEPSPSGEVVTLLIRFTAKGGAKGEATARGAEGKSTAFCAAAARDSRAPIRVRGNTRALEFSDDGRVEFLGQQSGVRADGSKFTRFLFNLIYIGDERREPTVYVIRGSGVVRLTITEIKTPRGAILAYTFEGKAEEWEIDN